MSDDPAAPPTGGDLVIDLSFAPAWTRKPAATPPEGDHPAPAYREPSRGDRPPRRDGRPGERRDDRRGPPRGARPEMPRPRPAPLPSVPEGIEVEFLPERRGLAPLATRLAAARRAYALFDVAHQFLAKPDYFQVRLALAPPPAPAAGGAPAATVPATLWQCGQCHAVFLRRETLAAHAFDKHFDTFCRREVVEAEPPRGNFVCVARCRLSGDVLGPPNYHGFADRLTELHRRRFGHMAFEAFRATIENVHDPAAIEAWKNEVRKQTNFRFGEGETSVLFTRYAEAEAHFREHCLPPLVTEGRRFVLPGPVAVALDDPSLALLLRERLQQEQRFPLKLSIALRLAFRHLGLHAFKAPNGVTFLSAVLPVPLDPAVAVPTVRAILQHLAAHPGATRVELQAALAEVGAGAIPPAEVTAQLHWLVDKGHVIEFGDGRMAAPAPGSVRHVQAAHAAEPHHHAHLPPHRAPQAPKRGRKPGPRAAHDAPRTEVVPAAGTSPDAPEAETAGTDSPSAAPEPELAPGKTDVAPPSTDTPLSTETPP